MTRVIYVREHFSATLVSRQWARFQTEVVRSQTLGGSIYIIQQYNLTKNLLIHRLCIYIRYSLERFSVRLQLEDFYLHFILFRVPKFDSSLKIHSVVRIKHPKRPDQLQTAARVIVFCLGGGAISSLYWFDNYLMVFWSRSGKKKGEVALLNDKKYDFTQTILIYDKRNSICNWFLIFYNILKSWSDQLRAGIQLHVDTYNFPRTYFV